MPLSPATRLGPYEIVGTIGAGGMGVVYRARDMRLHRDVAIKVLPDLFAGDPERLARFEREAHLLASLNHPNIAQIYGLEEAAGTHALVMELVEGEDLAHRVGAGPIPLDEALPIAAQIAEALEAAHDRGVIHRDLKPANIKVTPDGTVKILDFGLAKILDAGLKSGTPGVLTPAIQGSNAGGLYEQPPTITSPATQLGTIIGTAAYMAPEQARGKPVDRRADIWAFGVVLYEMLTGRRAFPGEDITDVLARVIEREPDWSALPAVTPRRVRELLRRCLDKDHRRRLRDMGEARVALTDTAATARDGPERPPADWRMWMALGLSLAATAVTGYLLGSRGASPGASPILTSFTQLTDQPGVERQPTIAPDGKTVVFASSVRGNSDLYLLRVGGRNSILLTGDSDADDYAPAFSPDGNLIAFRSERGGGGIFVMEATGESVRRVTDLGFDPHWSPDGRFLVVADERIVDPMSRALDSELWVVTVADGSRRRVAQADAVGGRWSPNGRRIVFWGIARRRGSERDIATVAADGSEAESPVWITADAAVDWSPTWSPDGRYIYFASSRGGTMNLWRVGIDEASGRTLSPLEPVTTPTTWSGHVEVAADGRSLVFADQDERTTIWSARFDPDRAVVVGQPATVMHGRAINSIDLSPDSQRVVFSQRGQPWEALGIVRLDGSGWSRLTDDDFYHRLPTWSPDGQRLLFYMNRSPGRLWTLRPDASGLTEILLPESDSGATYPVWSPDGARVAIAADAGLLVIDPSSSPARLLARFDVGRDRSGATGGDGMRPYSWSPDGRFLVGATRYGIRNQLVSLNLQTLEYRVLTGDAGSPVWLPDGRRILFTGSTHLMLFDTRTGTSRAVMPLPRKFDEWGRTLSLSRDGRTLVYLQSQTEGDVWLLTLEGSGR